MSILVSKILVQIDDPNREVSALFGARALPFWRSALSRLYYSDYGGEKTWSPVK